MTPLTVSLRSYHAFSHARAQVWFGEDEPRLTLALPNVDDPSKLHHVAVGSLYPDEGFDARLPRELRAEATVWARSIQDAERMALGPANLLGAFLSFTTNAFVSPFEPHVVLATNPVAPREFMQRPYSFETELPRSRRPVDSGAVTAFAAAVMSHSLLNQRQFDAALHHFWLALQRWEPGEELPAVSALYMAMEALKPVALSCASAQAGESWQNVAKRWAVENAKCPAGHTLPSGVPNRGWALNEARERTFFSDDLALHRTVRALSDDYEHGSEEISKLTEEAKRLRTEVMRRLRQGMLDLSGVNPSTRHTLTSPPYADPLPRQPNSLRLIGHLSGELATAQATVKNYPRFNWDDAVAAALHPADDPTHLTLGPRRPGTMWPPAQGAFDGELLADDVQPARVRWQHQQS